MMCLTDKALMVMITSSSCSGVMAACNYRVAVKKDLAVQLAQQIVERFQAQV